MAPYDFARAVFDDYAATDAPILPVNEMSALQVRLYRWQKANFRPSGVEQSVLGVGEELGELTEAIIGLAACAGRLNHATLKNLQGIRGMRDERAFRERAADAIADMMIFATQVCTTLRIDFGALYHTTATEVMKREWKKEP